MPNESRRRLTEAAVLEALAHPVRLALLNHLMSAGPATASACARAVHDTPSNCSYHLRVLAGHRLVESTHSADGRERPWRATITGFTTDDSARPGSRAARGAAALRGATVRLDQQQLRDYVSRRASVPAAWRAVDSYANYTLRLTPAELDELASRLDALIRPLIAATREDAPSDAELVHVGLQAFPLNPRR